MVLVLDGEIGTVEEEILHGGKRLEAIGHLSTLDVRESEGEKNNIHINNNSNNKKRE
jgi:hypothetical protein